MMPQLAEQPESMLLDDTSGVAPPQYGENNIELPEQIQNAVKAIIKRRHEQDKFDRRREVLRDRKNRFYERGFQHVYATNGGFYAQMSPGGVVSTAGGNAIQAPNKIDDYNIFQPYLRVLVSILTQNLPGIKFEPINPNLAEDTEAAETAENYRNFFDRTNDVPKLMKQIVRMYGVSSRCVVWTRTEANGERFGFNSDGTPKKTELSEIFGTLETKVPLLARSQKDVNYCFIMRDIDISQAKYENPEIADKIKAGSSGLGESAYERTARLGVFHGSRSQAQVGDAMTHVVTESYCFLRPSAWDGKEDGLEQPLEVADPDSDVGEDGAVMTVGQKLAQLFPTGGLLKFEGDAYAGSRSVSMDDEIVISFPYEGDGMFRMALMDPMIPVQDRFNDNMNAAAEIFDYGWPSRWVDCTQQDYDAIADQKADPYAYRRLETRDSREPLEQSFFQEPDPELPDSFMKYTELLEGPLAQFILAAPPALFGGAMEDQKTASGYAQARAQAMGQQGIVWSELQRVFARIRFQAAMCAANNPDYAEEIVVPGTNGQSTLQLARLKKGKFGAYPDEDSSFPESTAAKRATFIQLIEMASQSPMGGQIFQSPDNWALFARLNGFSELKIPEAASREKQLFEIEQLLKMSPLPVTPEEMAQSQMAAQDATVTGMEPPPPPMPQSSIPVLPLDYHQWEFEKGREWLASPACRQQLAAGNQAGVENVQLHTMEHFRMMAIAPPEPQPPTAIPGQQPAPKGAEAPNRAIAVPAPGAPGAATM